MSALFTCAVCGVTMLARRMTMIPTELTCIDCHAHDVAMLASPGYDVGALWTLRNADKGGRHWFPRLHRSLSDEGWRAVDVSMKRSLTADGMTGDYIAILYRRFDGSLRTVAHSNEFGFTDTHEGDAEFKRCSYS